MKKKDDIKKALEETTDYIQTLELSCSDDRQEVALVSGFQQALIWVLSHKNINTYHPYKIEKEKDERNN